MLPYMKSVNIHLILVVKTKNIFALETKPWQISVTKYSYSKLNRWSEIAKQIFVTAEINHSYTGCRHLLRLN
jgi:hypothetical protein